MMPAFSQRILPLLQLTRMALVFTAISDSMCGLLLRVARQHGGSGSVWAYLEPSQTLAVVAMSVGLYGFGMSLNDIIDRRRDRHLAAHRPLPSGRVGVVAAHVICFGLLAMALAASVFYARKPINAELGGWPSIVLAVWTAMLIAFYDFAGKYLVWPGLLSLGLIRFFHAVIAAPEMPLLWQPLFLLNHVAILSTVAYVWEAKRPRLKRWHWWSVLGGLAVIDVAAITMVALNHYGPGPLSVRALARALSIHWGLLWPVAAGAAFFMLGALVRLRTRKLREAGQKLMLYGLLWLIVYDAAFAAGYVSWSACGALLLLLPVAYISVQLMRWWSRLVMVSQKPQFVRAAAK